jgi:hypothetical protein
MLTRRDFIKGMAWLGGVVLFPFNWLAKSSSLPETGSKAEGELYAGFVLLPEGAPVPDFVQPPKLRPCHEDCAGAGGEDCGLGFVTRHFGGAEDLAREAGFPLYTLNSFLPGLYLANAYIVGYTTGEIDSAWLGFDAYDTATNYDECLAFILALPDFPRPYPLWSSGPVEPGGPAVVLEKVDLLSIPEIRVVNDWERVYYWIQDDVFYTLCIRNDLLRQIAGIKNLGQTGRTETLEGTAETLLEALIVIR